MASSVPEVEPKFGRMKDSITRWAWIGLPLRRSTVSDGAVGDTRIPCAPECSGSARTHATVAAAA